MRNILKNWKTTLAGVIIAGIGLATKLGYITPDLSTSIVTVLSSFGVIIAKDGE